MLSDPHYFWQSPATAGVYVQNKMAADIWLCSVTLLCLPSCNCTTNFSPTCTYCPWADGLWTSTTLEEPGFRWPDTRPWHRCGLPRSAVAQRRQMWSPLQQVTSTSYSACKISWCARVVVGAPWTSSSLDIRHDLQGGPKKTGLFFRLDNFVMVSPRKACSMSKFSQFYREKGTKLAFQWV